MVLKNNILASMDVSPFDEMQKAVDIVDDSRHPTSKVAATIYGIDQQRPYSISKTNYWPTSIEDKIGTEVSIGNSSGTIHAETACIIKAPYTKDASLCITDPFCPNCAKNIAEAGIKTIYIDHKGFAKDFAERRGHQFKKMSMQICEKAGISVYELHRKEQKLIPILEVSEAYHPYDENPVEIEAVPEADENIFKDFIAIKSQENKGRKLAVAFARDKNRRAFGITAISHPAMGYSSDKDIEEIEHPESKYSFMMEPVNRLLMAAPRNGLHIVNGLVFCSQIPTAREQVNIVGADLSSITIRNMTKARDDWAFKAMDALGKAEILSFYEL